MKFVIQDDQTDSNHDVQEEPNKRNHRTREVLSPAYQPGANPYGQSSLLGSTPTSGTDAGGRGSSAFLEPIKFTPIRPSSQGCPPHPAAGDSRDQPIIIDDDDDDGGDGEDDETLFLSEKPKHPSIIARHFRFSVRRKNNQSESVPYHLQPQQRKHYSVPYHRQPQQHEPRFFYEKPQPPPIFARYFRFTVRRKHNQSDSVPYHPQPQPQYDRITADSNDTTLKPLGHRCRLCNIDLAFTPSGSSSDSVPVHVVLPCGHCYHSSCFEEIHGYVGKDEIPSCFCCSQGGD